MFNFIEILSGYYILKFKLRLNIVFFTLKTVTSYYLGYYVYTYSCTSSCIATSYTSSGVATTISCCQTSLCNNQPTQSVSTTSNLQCYVGTVSGKYYGVATTCSSSETYCQVSKSLLIPFVFF